MPNIEAGMGGIVAMRVASSSPARVEATLLPRIVPRASLASLVHISVGVEE